MYLKNTFWNKQETRLRAGWRIIIQFAIFFLIISVFDLLDSFLIGYLPRSPFSQSKSVLVPLEMLTAIFFSVWLAGKLIDKRGFKDFGFNLTKSWWYDLTVGLVIGAILISFVFFTEFAAGWLVIANNFQNGKEITTFVIPIAICLISFIVVGFYEELHIRGYVLTNLSEGFNFNESNPKIAIIIATVFISLLFGFAHAFNPNASLISSLCLTITSLVWASAYILTGKLAISIGIHITWNFFQGCVYGFPVSGRGLGASLISIQQNGPEIWTGGSFGPEAGLLCIVANFFGVLLIMFWVKLKSGEISLKEAIANYDGIRT
jgi:membrane protease YdiL (CAAX protease family)